MVLSERHEKDVVNDGSPSVIQHRDRRRQFTVTAFNSEMNAAGIDIASNVSFEKKNCRLVIL